MYRIEFYTDHTKSQLLVELENQYEDARFDCLEEAESIAQVELNDSSNPDAIALVFNVRGDNEFVSSILSRD